METTIIYNRVSTEEQNPENQLKDCIKLVSELNITNYEVLEEKKSAWKNDNKREVFNEIRQRIIKSNLKNLIVWDLDNKKTK